MSDETSLPRIEGVTVEGWKHYFEFLKHMTTIDTASILLIATLVEKLFANPEWKALVVVCLLLLVLSLLGSLSGMFLVSTLIGGVGHKSEKTGLVITWLVTAGCLFLGIATLIVFFVKNFL